MRYLFFLVLLANVIFYFWHWRTEALKPLIEPNVSKLSQSNQQIFLLSEVEDLAIQPYQANEQAISADNAAEMVCYEAGPFANKQEVLEWDEQNLIKSENMTFQFKDVEVVDGYLLFYPAPETLVKAEENVAILEAKGVNDLWLFRFGNMKGAISLGFYDSAKQAIHAQEILEKLGVDAKIRKHAMPKNHIFSRIIWRGDDQKINELVASFKEKFPDKTLKKCQLSE
jgi:hypothetical protein